MNYDTHSAECLHGLHGACSCENACACGCHNEDDEFILACDAEEEEDFTDERQQGLFEKARHGE